MKYLLDTNICVYVVNRSKPSVREHLLRLRRDQLAMSAVTWTALRSGAERSDHRETAMKKILTLADGLTIEPFDEGAAAAAAEILAKLRRAGTPVGPYDALIAGHAVSLGATLVTHNTREFRRIAGLKLEDWVSE